MSEEIDQIKNELAEYQALVAKRPELRPLGGKWPIWTASLITTIESQKEEIESLKWKIAHPVFCQGICKSQRDDYCGYHMSNEDCRACNSIWTNAHVENAKFDSKAITELAVKGLEESKIAIKCSSDYHLNTCTCAECNALGSIEFILSEIERLSQ